jgi:hypothetical protein
MTNVGDPPINDWHSAYGERQWKIVMLGLDPGIHKSPPHEVVNP